MNKDYTSNNLQNVISTPLDIEADLKKKWVSLGNPISFSGISKIHSFYGGNITRKKIKQILSTLSTYTKYKEYKRPKYFNPYFIYFKHQNWQIDLIYVMRLNEWNDGVMYILSVIEVFSRKLFIAPLKSKTTENTIESFQRIHNYIGQSPKTIYADKGGEFNSIKFKRYCDEYRIKLLFSESVYKASIVERSQKTFQNIMYKYMTHFETNRYIDRLSEITNTFNNKVNRTIGLSPNDAYKEENKSIVLYNLEVHYKKALSKRRPPQFNINDRVRILRLFNNKEFAKKVYITKFTDEIFTIVRVNNRLPFTRYYIKGGNGEEIEGGFQAWELVKIMRDTPSNRVDTIRNSFQILADRVRTI